MLAKCANPECVTEFRRIENGTLFRLENEQRCPSQHTFREYFWMCRGCSSGLTLRLNAAGRIRVAETTEPLAQQKEDSVDFVLLDRQYGMLLSQITLFQHHGQRHEKAEGGHQSL